MTDIGADQAAVQRQKQTDIAVPDSFLNDDLLKPEVLYAQAPVLSQKIIGMVTDRTDQELPVPVFLLGADAYVTKLADFLEQSLSLVGSSS